MEVRKLLDEHIVEHVQVAGDQRARAALHHPVRFAELFGPFRQLEWTVVEENVAQIADEEGGPRAGYPIAAEVRFAPANVPGNVRFRALKWKPNPSNL